jgi:hypothetical protein
VTSGFIDNGVVRCECTTACHPRAAIFRRRPLILR